MIITKQKCAPWGKSGTYDIEVTSKGVRVYEPKLKMFVACHSLSPRKQASFKRMAGVM
jgi:hypothetical protein